jgi:5-methylthioribose kinase
MLFKPVIPVVEYVVFYDYIKNELCENKDKPKLECNGKCHLKKELAKASDSTEKGNDKKHFSVETIIVFYQEIEENFGFKPYFYLQKSKVTSNYNLSYSHLETNSVFRPPIV